jgi:hypothetical protein
MKLLGVRDLKLVLSLFALKCNLWGIESIYYHNTILGRYLFAGIIELSTFVAPIICTTNNLGRGGGVLNTFRDDMRDDFHTFNRFNWYKEGMIVKALKLK